MSVVIIGGNECMEGNYKEMCKKYGFAAKVFTKESGSMKKKIGTPDLLVLFTNTVSHKMVFGVVQEAKRSGIPIARSHSSSMAALESILTQRTC
ncbi:MAG TPA: DUF2325 domain-containing protein [Bacillota bacterium]|nr:DUF2325 domain-containing protein [Bacillota bacterium]